MSEIGVARLEELRAKYAALDTPVMLPALELRHWAAAEERRVGFSEAAAVLQAGTAVRAGWLRGQRALHVLRGAEELPSDDPILEGELLLEDGSTLVLRPDGGGGVRLVRHRDATAAFEGSQPVLTYEARQLAAPRARSAGIRELRHRVYLAVGAEQGARAVASRFVGFGLAEGEQR